MSIDTLPQKMRLSGSLDIQAAEKGKKHPKFSLVANTGQPMKLKDFFAPVVVDLAGASFAKKKTPVIADHEPSLRIGHTLKQTIDRAGIRAEGIVSSSSLTAISFVNDAKQGYPFEVSIGADIDEAFFVPADESVSVNGKNWPGPVIVAKRVSIRELTICVLGADASTSANITAKRYTPNEKEPTMTTDIQADREKVAQEELRLDRIRAVANQYDTLSEVTIEGRKFSSISEAKAHAISSGMHPDTFELACRRSSYPKQDKAPVFHRTNHPGALNAESLQAAILTKAGFHYVAEKTMDARTMEAAHSMRHLSLPDICRISIEAQGREAPASRAECVHQAMLTASSGGGFSTLSLANLLGGGIDKILGIVFQEAGSSWKGFAAIKSLPNFRPHSTHGVFIAGDLEKVPADGVFSHSMMLEENGSLKIDTYATMLKISRQALIDDDLGALSTLASSIVAVGRRKLNDLVYEVILGNAGDHFHTDNANYATGGDSALDATSLAAGLTAIRKQRGPSSEDLDIVPKVLVVCPELELTAKALINSMEVAAAEGQPTGNALQGSLALAVESRISNSDRFANASTTKWFIFGGPEVAPVNVGFLDGVETLHSEFFGLDHEVNQLAVAYRIYGDFGASLGEYRAGYMSDGQ